MRWQPPGLDGLRVARDMVSCQTFWSLGRGARHAGQNFTPGLMSRLSLQVGHLTFMSLILLSLPMGGEARLVKSSSIRVQNWGKVIARCGIPGECSC